MPVAARPNCDTHVEQSCEVSIRYSEVFICEVHILLIARYSVLINKSNFRAILVGAPILYKHGLIFEISLNKADICTILTIHLISF